MVVNNFIKIGKQKIGENQRVFVIAEVGINHNGDFKIAKSLITAAKEAGADAVKFQTYITKKRVPKDSSIYNILKKCEFNETETKELINFAKEKEIIFFSTPFDEESVEILVNNNVPLMKIASFDLTNQKLLKKVAETGIPVIMSRGIANKQEIDRSLNILKDYETKYAILHCVSAYPTEINDANLNIINSLKSMYNCPIGYSDHTLGIEVAYLSVAVGASIVEKHFTLDTNQEGPDHKLSADPEMLKNMIKKIRKIETILGSGKIKMLECEKGTFEYRNTRISSI